MQRVIGVEGPAQARHAHIDTRGQEEHRQGRQGPQVAIDEPQGRAGQHRDRRGGPARPARVRPHGQAEGHGRPPVFDRAAADKEHDAGGRQVQLAGKEDLAVIDKSIGNARSTLAGGETQATIQAGSSPASPSDQALKEVTAVVGQIAMAIVKSDDVVQLCLLALGSTTGSQDTTREKFATWCQKELELEQKKREIYLTTFPPLIEAAQAVISDPSKSADEKRGAKENLNRLSTELEREGLKYVIKPETNGIPIKPLDFLPNFFK